MKVVHATECAASGTLDVIVALARELANNGARQTLVYCPRAETPPNLRALFPPGMEFVRVTPASGFHVRFAYEFARALNNVVHTFEPDAVHLHSSKAGFVGRMAKVVGRWSCRTLYSPHGLSFLDPDRPAVNSVFRFLEALAARTGATPVGCGRSEADILAKLSGREALLLENPVDDRFFAIERAPAPVPTVVSMGRLSRQKAPERFAAVAREVHRVLPSARFLWIGDGDPAYRAELAAYFCEVTGWLKRDEVASILGSADLYVQTSRWEGLPISVIQALAAGVPCIVNDCVGNRDAVTNESTGYVVRSVEQTSEKVLRILDDGGLRDRLSANAKAEASRRFGLTAFARRVVQVYGLAESDIREPKALEPVTPSGSIAV